MNLILKKEVKASFEKQWLTSYVPAIILYGKKCRKKTITTLIKDMNELGKQQKENVDFYTSASLLIIDDPSKQVTALQILIECMSGRKSVAQYIYEECEVSTLYYHCTTLIMLVFGIHRTHLLKPWPNFTLSGILPVSWQF